MSPVHDYITPVDGIKTTLIESRSEDFTRFHQISDDFGFLVISDFRFRFQILEFQSNNPSQITDH